MPDPLSVPAPDPSFGDDAGRVPGPLPPRRVTIERWGAALADHDDIEVERLVRQSRIDRAWVVSSE